MNALNLRNITLVAFVTACSTSINANGEDVSGTTMLTTMNRIVSSNWDTGYQVRQEMNIAFPPRKDLKERYCRIAKANWFQEAYHDMSVGDVLSIE